MSNFNYFLGTAVSSWLLAILVIASELSAPFKTILKDVFTHHWVAKAVLVTLAFVLAGFLFRGTTTIGKYSVEKAAWQSSIGSLVVILLFYIVEFFV